MIPFDVFHFEKDLKIATVGRMNSVLENVRNNNNTEIIVRDEKMLRIYNLLDKQNKNHLQSN